MRGPTSRRPRSPGTVNVAETLFRTTPLPSGLDVFDVHVNALPADVAPPTGIYRTVSIDDVLAGARTERAAPGESLGRAHEATGARPRFRSGCVTPPAGIDLLDGSRRLRARVDEPDGRRWRALLRLDAGGGARPVAGPLSGPRGALARRGARDGRVGRTLLAEPALLDGFAGVKLMPQATGLPGDEVLAVLAERGLPVLVHAGILCPPRWIERHVLTKLGDCPLVLAHLGSWPCSADDLAHAVELAARDERVHLETSGANIGNFLRHAAERVPEKLLFGSNRPMCPPPVQFAHVAASVHDDDVLRAIARGNAERLFAHASVHALADEPTGTNADTSSPTTVRPT